MNSKTKYNSTWTYILLCGLVIYMPFHYWICELFLKNSSIDNIVRDIIIIILLVIVYNRRALRIRKDSTILAVNAIVLILFSIGSYIIFDYPNTFNIMRTYLLPILFGMACTEITITKDQISKVLGIIVVEHAIIGMWGFFQAFVLGGDFIIRMGYPSQNGFLSTTAYYINGFFGYQRSVGTYISPNVCGTVLAIALCVVLFGGDLVKLRYKPIWVISLVIGIIATLSRSSIFGIIVAWVIIKLTRKKHKINLKTILISIGIIIVGIPAVIFVDSFYLDGLFSSMVQSSLLGAINRTDLSTLKHIEDLTAPMSVVLSHPLGRGLGCNGPMALGTTPVALNVESSIFLMMFEIGILFGILYFIPIVKPIFDLLVKSDALYIVTGAVCIAIGVTCILLPTTQTYESMFFTFMFIGLSLNKRISAANQ